jgi:hypothetical protein
VDSRVFGHIYIRRERTGKKLWCERCMGVIRRGSLCGWSDDDEPYCKTCCIALEKQEAARG